jgi:nitroreductase
MDILESIRKRRFHRSFTAEPVDEASLARLIWAAGRAPMGGNELVRRIVVVTDPGQMRTLRQVTPSFLANAPAAIVICTDLERAEASMGRQGRDVLSLVDAGAAAENVALTAVALGLAACFVRSSNDVAMQQVLGLPASVRPDILIAVGHPSATPTPAMKNPPAVVYRDRFGGAWDPPPAESAAPRPQTAPGASPERPDGFVMALYLVSSARDCLDEPLIYGPFRMVEGVSRLLEGARGDTFLTEMKAVIDREKYNVMADRESFARWLDDLLRDFAAEAGRRNASVQMAGGVARDGHRS